jgi:hypothetical protein
MGGDRGRPTTTNVRATFEAGAWSIVVVVPAFEGRGARGLVVRVDLDLQVLAADLWGAIVAAAAASGISLPPTAAAPPTSPGAGVREWRLASTG